MVVKRTTREINREIRHLMYGENAVAAIGKLEKGCEIFGLSKGQFSIINIIEAVLNQIGKSDILISTWVAASYDIKKTKVLEQNGLINNIHFILDKSAKSKVGATRFNALESYFPGKVSLTNSHSKFVLLRNDSWKIVIRTSMNLNENKRLENFEISDCPALYDYLALIGDDIIKQRVYSFANFRILGRDEKYKSFLMGLGSGTIEKRKLLLGKEIFEEKILQIFKEIPNKKAIFNFTSSLGLEQCTECFSWEDRFFGSNQSGAFVCKDCL